MPTMKASELKLDDDTAPHRAPPVPYRVAIVHDWLVTYAGSERVVAALLSLFPESDLFSIVDFLSDKERERLHGKKAQTSFVQKLPFARRRYRSYFPIMPVAIEQFDLSGYDLIISSSHAVAKGVITGPGQLHICYCHTPVRYAWDLQHRYLKETGLDRGLKSVMARLMLHYIRMWDVRTTNGVDHFVTNSDYVGRRVRRIYGRESTTVYPPVDTRYFTPSGKRESYYLTASRMVPYKRMDLIVEAFRYLPDRKLIVIGDGPERAKIEKLGGPNVEFLGYQPDDVMKQHLQRAQAFIFAAEEDFGILPLEAQACGTPVIAYGKGGALETVVDIDNATGADATGVLFYRQVPEAISSAIMRFEAADIAPGACRAWAENFSLAHFQTTMSELIASAISDNRQIGSARTVMG
ncbi:glycosyltransferase family 4 protein [Acidocella sp.]|uniref:glycosyltransferase family 4 protein n=1 Tax=Acidocella sp. TaxID=50710 RepID=UPI0026175334|nr:glycosyltransferase family 4 protein [Acidocella sp.]